MANNAKNKKYEFSVRGGIRRVTIGKLSSKIAKILSKIEPDDDEDLREYLEDLDDVFFIYALSAEAFTINVIESEKNKTIFTTNQDDKNLEKTIKEYFVDEPGVFVSTTQNERGIFGSFILNLELKEKFDASLISLTGVWPKDTASGPLITQIHYEGKILDHDENYETDISAFQVDFFEVGHTKGNKIHRSDLDINEALTKSKIK